MRSAPPYCETAARYMSDMAAENTLLYNVTWSVDGLANEYCNPCEMIVDGTVRQGTPLEDVESVLINGTRYEAFNTSGGLGTLTETLHGTFAN